jgi:transcriptional regulator NrdR family protein
MLESYKGYNVKTDEAEAERSKELQTLKRRRHCFSTDAKVRWAYLRQSKRQALSAMKTAVVSFPWATNKIKSIHRRADHKSGLNLKARRFRVEIQTPEANVQHG